MLLISDLHFGSYLPLEAEAHLIQAALADEDKFVLISGDITMHSKEAEFARAENFINVLKQNGITIAATPGNHDFGGPAAELLHKVTSNYERARALLDHLFQLLYIQPEVIAYNAKYFDSIVQHRNNVFVCLKSQHRSGPRIKKCQIDWAQEKLATLPNDPERKLYFMCHHSLWQDASDHHGAMGQLERVEEFLSNNKFCAFIHGHNHRFTYQNTTTPVLGYRIRRLAAPTACTKNRDWERGYVMWHPPNEAVLVQLPEAANVEDEGNVAPQDQVEPQSLISKSSLVSFYMIAYVVSFLIGDYVTEFT